MSCTQLPQVWTPSMTTLWGPYWQDAVHATIFVILLSRMQNLDHEEPDETKLRDTL